MSIGRHEALKDMRIIHENDILVGVRRLVGALGCSFEAPASSAELCPVGFRSRLGKRPLTPLPRDVYQPGLTANIGLTFHCLLAL